MAKNETKEKNVGFTPLRKISVATVYGKIDFEKLMTEKKKPLSIMEVYGIAGRMKPGTTDLGAYVKFIGQFRAKNCETGELFRSAVLLLPRFLEEDLAGAMISGVDTETKQAEFAVRISAIYDAKAATKYVYIADSMVEPVESDAMRQLEQRVAVAHKQLSAPK